MKKILIWLLVGFALVTLGTCAFTFYYISTGAVTPQEISSEQTSRDSLLNSLGNKQIDSTVLAKIPNHTLLQNEARLWDSYYVDSLDISYVIRHKDQKIVWLTSGEKGAAEHANKLQSDRDKQIEGQFSAWDGSHKTLTKSIKESLNDPGSYEHVETRYRVQNDSIIIFTTFRGKNAFGGMLTKQVKGIADLKGNILQAEYLN